MRCWPRPSNERGRWQRKMLRREGGGARAALVSGAFEYARVVSYDGAGQARATAWLTLQADGSVLIRCAELSCLATWRAESATFDSARGQGASFPDCTYGTHAAEVEVDPETGEVRVLRYIGSHDVGRAIIPMRVEGQIQGGAMQGLGYALTEEIVLEDGLTASSLFSSYFIPTAADMPDVEAEIGESGEGKGPLNVRGTGEPPGGPVPPAIATAIAHATGAPPTRPPPTAQGGPAPPAAARPGRAATARRGAREAGRGRVGAAGGTRGRGGAGPGGACRYASRIYVPAGTAATRITDIESEGAPVALIDGDYDEAVRQCARDAGEGCLVVSDTSWRGYERIPAWVIDGYATMFWEVHEQLPDADRLIHAVAVPVRVGALPAAAR